MAESTDNELRMKRLRGVYFGLLGKVDGDLQRDDKRRHELNHALAGADCFPTVTIPVIFG